MPELDNPWDSYETALAARRAWEEQRAFWTGVMSTPLGRREMWKLLSTTHAFSTHFAQSNGGFPDPNATWFKAGAQQWGMALYHQLMQFAPDGTALMMVEYVPDDKPEIPSQPFEPRPDIET